MSDLLSDVPATDSVRSRPNRWFSFRISLKWRIFLFFVLFGMIPLVLTSYFAVVAYTQSVRGMTDKYVSDLVERVADQINSTGYMHFKYLDVLSKYPFVQLSFLRHPGAGLAATTQDKLELFRLNTDSFTRIVLYANDGRVVAATPSALNRSMEPIPPPDTIEEVGRFNYYHRTWLNREHPVVALYKRVYDYSDADRAVGIIGAEVLLDNYIQFLGRLEIGEGAEKVLFNNAGKVLYREGPAADDSVPAAMAEFATAVPLLDWRIDIRIPKSVLLKDVNRLIYGILGFYLLVVVGAVTASLVFSRRAVKPLEQIIAGTRAFARGDLDHRITIPYGVETKRVAEAFNQMAGELQRRHVELMQADKLASLGLLVAGLAHEIRNPLAGIKTGTQVLARHCSAEGTRNLARGITKEVDRLNRIVTDLLHFARPGPAPKGLYRIDAVVDRSLKVIGNEIDRKRVTLVNRAGGQWARVAHDQMVQMLINLLLNALAAVEPETGRIELLTRDLSECRFELEIRDNGHGIPAHQIERIFDPFFSLSPEGSGLGLSIVHTLATQNDVGLRVESPEGKGTLVRLIFETAREKAQGA